MSDDVCRGFQWIGQSFAHCEGCGRDIRDHQGLDWLKPGASPFAPLDEVRELLPFDEAMERIPLFAHYVTPIGGGRPYRWERVGMSEAKVVTVRQPFASLVACGAKTLLDRPRPTGYRGRLLIRAAKRRPTQLEILRDLKTDEAWLAWEAMGYSRRVKYDNCEALPGPLGVVVASCELVECVPMVDQFDARALFITPAERLMLGGEDVTDQLPFGDFAPGRWAWLLDDVRPTTERCPRCWGEARTIEPSRSGPGLFDGPCPTCRATPGHCAPVRMRGGPGLRTPEWET